MHCHGQVSMKCDVTVLALKFPELYNQSIYMNYGKMEKDILTYCICFIITIFFRYHAFQA